jgi:decaprenylphospho-beta-D-erythro-pentofuranosid-2-ulose 2-reductase
MRILVLGSGSGIARAVVNELVSRGIRPEDVCLSFRGDTQERSDHHPAIRLDALDEPSEELRLWLQGNFQPDAVLLAWGIMVDEASGSEHDFQLQTKTNCTASLIWLEQLASWLRDDGVRANFAVLGSVAGDRLRASNFHYGKSKQDLANGVSRLRVDFPEHSWCLIKPGPIATAMTAGLKPPLMVSAESIAPTLIDAWLSGKAEVYLPGFWRWIMLLLRALPEWIWRRLPI